MRITLVVVLCSLTAVALASPTSELLGALSSELKVQGETNTNYDDIAPSLRKYMERFHPPSPKEFIPYRVINEPKPIIKEPKPIEEPERSRSRSESSSKSKSKSGSSSRNMVHESDVNQKQDSMLVKSFKELLAHYMQDDQCPVKADCHEPLDVAICDAFTGDVTDDRQNIENPENTTPNQWVCRLDVDGAGGKWYGTAFKVKISPDIGRTVLFTAAHVLRDEGKRYVPRVKVQCPGEDEVIVERNSDRDMYMSEEFLNHERWLYNYAYITYPGNSNTGFGFQGFFDRVALANTDLHACGYPTPLHQDTCIARCPNPVARQYCNKGKLTRLYYETIQANVDMDFGEGGGPLYDATADNYVAYGIISLVTDDCPGGRNYQRLNAEALHDMFSHMGDIDMNYKLKGTPNVYLHMNGTGLSTLNRIGGSVYAGFANNVDDTFKIFPIKQSSSNQPDTQLVAIRSATQENIYLRLDGTGVTSYLLRGGGTANCRFGIDDGALETFHREIESDGQVAFRSTEFNNVYLRLDHWHVKAPEDRGQVNAQFGKYTLETNHLETFP